MNTKSESKELEARLNAALRGLYMPAGECLRGGKKMRIYKVKMLIAAVPFATEWTVTVTDLKRAFGKAKAEMRLRGIIPADTVLDPLYKEVLSYKDI